VPGTSLFLINPLEGFVEICCKSKKSRSSAKIRDHATKAPIRRPDPTRAQREVGF
jgi:hypothetical protein